MTTGEGQATPGQAEDVQRDAQQDAQGSQEFESAVKEEFRTSGPFAGRATRGAGDIDRRFTFHPPQPSQLGRYELIRRHAKEFATFITDNTPTSREQSLAITHLEETVMWANAAIARNE